MVSRVLKAPRCAAYAGLVPAEFRLLQVPYEHPDVTALTSAAQEFYITIYGGPDATPFTSADFSPPTGVFLVGYLDDQALSLIHI